MLFVGLIPLAKSVGLSQIPLAPTTQPLKFITSAIAKKIAAASTGLGALFKKAENVRFNTSLFVLRKGIDTIVDMSIKV